MQEIIFSQTHNVFLNNGIVGLYRYLQKAERADLLSIELVGLKAFPIQKGVHFDLEPPQFWSLSHGTGILRAGVLNG